MNGAAGAVGRMRKGAVGPSGRWPGDRPAYVFRLYIAGMTRRSRNAVSALTDLFEQRLHDPYDFKIIDLYRHPRVATEQQIVAAPTLVRERPLPQRRLIGDMTDRKKVIDGLEMDDPS